MFVSSTLNEVKLLSVHPELYEYCLDEGIADRNLIAKWKKVRRQDRERQRERTSSDSSRSSLMLTCTSSPLSLQSGYENLCCLRCIQPRDTNFGTTCICRVPKSKLETVNNHLLK